MPFDSPAGRADVEFRANTGQFKADVSEARRVYEATTGSMSTGALRAAAAQEKLDRAIARHGPDSLAAKNATIAYRREMEALSVEQNRTAAGSARLGSSFHRTERDLDRMGRGIVAGSGLLRGLGRSAAFASSYFLGGFGLVYAIRSTLDVAKESDDVLARTQNAIEAAGLSWGRYGGQIQRTALRLQDVTKFQDEELLSAFATVIRRNGDVAESWRIVSAATNFSRATNLGLEQSTRVLLRALNGQTAGLGRYAFRVEKVTAAQDALKASGEKVSAQQIAQAKASDAAATRQGVLATVIRQTAGAASRAQGQQTRTQEELNNALDDSQEIIGRALRPALAGVAVDAAHYLERLNRTGELQRKVNTVMHDGTEIVHGVRDAWRLLSVPIHAVTTALGGIDKAVETFLIIGAISKVTKFAASFGLIRAASEATKDKVIADAAQMNAALGGGGLSPAGIPTGDLRSQGGGGGLRGSLNRVSRRWPIQLQLIGAVAIAAVLVRLQQQLDKLGGTKTFQAQPGSGITDLGHGVSYDPASGQYINTGKGSAPGLAATLSEQEAARRLGVSVAALRSQQATASGAPVDIRSGSGIQLPTSQRATHQTSGLGGFPAVDIMAKPGTAIRAPEDGMITRISGHEPGEAPPQGQGGPWGLTIYFVGTQTGNTYFMTHLMKVGQPGSYKRGDVIGVIGDYPGSSADHVHFAIHKGRAADAFFGSTLISPSDYLSAPSGGRGGGTTKPPPPKIDLPEALRRADITSQRPGTPVAERLRVLRDEDAYYTRLLAQKGLKAGQRDDLLRSQVSVENEIQTILDEGARQRKTIADKAAAARKKRAEEEARRERQLHDALIAQVSGPSLDFRIREARLALLPENKRRDNREIALLQDELKAERQKYQLARQKLHSEKSRKELELAFVTEEGRIIDRIRQLRAQQTDMGGALQREFMSEYQGIVGQYAPNVLGGRGAGASSVVVHVHQNFPHPPTVDGHREATYARHAAMAAFDS